MPWDNTPGTGRFLSILLILALLLVIAMYYVISGIELPEPEVEEVPERFAQLIVQEEPEVEPPPPAVEEKPEEKPEEPEPVEEEIVEEQPVEDLPKPIEQPKPVEKPEQTVEQAREAVKSKGLLAFGGMPEVRRSSVANTDTKLVTAASSKRRVEASSASLDTDLSSGSGGVDTNIASDSGIAGNLGNRNVATVSNKVTTSKTERAGNASASGSPKGSLRRSPQQIAAALKMIQGRLDFLYNKARRRNPLLQGTVVFRVKLDQSGKVLAASVVRSDLNDPGLEKSMASRIQVQANFGLGPKETIEFPADFTP
ncbi:conserved hypothetical protein [gamma proteobacterium HTCC5015]|nr:conserved hypothetical protein [gamma proteobacterium HTCC5015]